MLDEELVEIVENLRALGGDVSDIEVKKSQRELPKTIGETLSAFSNTHGGILILGLDESANFAATGVRDAAKLSSDLASLCSTDMEPALRPLIRVHDFEDAKLVVAEVPELEPALKPCFYKGAGMTKGSFVRVGDGDRRSPWRRSSRGCAPAGRTPSRTASERNCSDEQGCWWPGMTASRRSPWRPFLHSAPILRSTSRS